MTPAMLGELGEWWPFIPSFTALLVASILPGWFWLRSTVHSSVVAIGAAPAFSFGIVVICSLLFDQAGVEWEASKVMPVLGLFALLGAVTWFFNHARRTTGTIPRPGRLVEAIGPRRPLGAHQIRVRTATWAMIFVGFVLAALPMLLRADPQDPVQQWDSTFHLNGVRSILSTKNASPFGGLQELYGGREVFYPTGWHAFVSIFVTSRTVIEVSNVSSLVLMAIWVVGATAFVSVITTSRAAILSAPVLAGTLLNMPADALTMYNQWPHAMGIAVLPGLASAAITVGRRVRDTWGQGVRPQLPSLGPAVFIAVSVVGAVGAHPSSAFTLVAMLAAPLLVSLGCFFKNAVRAKSLLASAGWFVAMAAVVVVPLAVLSVDKIQAMGNYPRSGISWSVAFSHAFVPYPPFSQTAGLTMLVLVQLVLVALGSSLMLRVGPAFRRWWGARPLDEDAAGAALRAEVSDTVGHMDLTGGVNTESGRVDEGTAVLVDDKAATMIGQPEAAPVPVPKAAPVPTTASILADPDLDPEAEAAPVLVDGAHIPAWPVASYLVFCALTFIAYMPDNPLREYLLAPWYMDARRIMGIHGLMMVPLMAVGFSYVTEKIHGLVIAIKPEHRLSVRWIIDVLVGLILIVLSAFGAIDARVKATDYVYDSMNLGKPGMATKAELAMLRRARLILPNEALVVGDPIAGEAYIEVIADKDTVFPQLTMANEDKYSQEILSQHFNEIHTNPQVCEVVRDLGITHFYEDEDGMYYNFMRSSRSPGLYNVDTSTGFELVDEGGTAKIWKITACGEVEGGGKKG